MFSLFGERPLNEYLTEKKERIFELIESRSESEIFEVNVKDINSLYINEFVDIPRFKFDEIYVEAKERKIDGNFKTVFVFKIPFIGDDELLKLEPDTHIVWTIHVDVENRNEMQVLCFEIIDNDDKVETIRDKSKANIQNIKIQLENFSAEVEKYNKYLPLSVNNKLEERKNRISRRNKKLKALQKMSYK